jgi:hypothetical protein
MEIAHRGRDSHRSRRHCRSGRGDVDGVFAPEKRRPISTLGADKGYDTRDFVRARREIEVRPYVTQNLNRPDGSAIDTRTARHAAGYEISQKKRH